GGDLEREVRPHRRGDQLRHRADDLPVGNLLPRGPVARAVPHGQPVQPVLLPDRRVPLRLHRQGRRVDRDRPGPDGGAGARPVVALLADAGHGLQAEDLTESDMATFRYLVNEVTPAVDFYVDQL